MPVVGIVGPGHEQLTVGGAGVLREDAEHIHAGEVPDVFAAVHIAANDGSGFFTGGIRILKVGHFQHGVGKRGAPDVAVRTTGQFGKAVCRIEAVAAFAYVPSVVAALLHHVDLLPKELPGVAGYELMVGAHVERKAKGIAEAVGPDLIEALFAHEGIVHRDAIGHGAVHIDAQDIAEEILLDVLAVAAGIHGVPVFHVAGAYVIGAAAVTD